MMVRCSLIIVLHSTIKNIYYISCQSYLYHLLSWYFFFFFSLFFSLFLINKTVAIGDDFVINKCLAIGPKRINAAPRTLVMPEFDGGKKALTTFHLKDRSSEGHELLLCTLETGRSHQIRVHLQSSGRSVLGDPMYGTLLTSESEFYNINDMKKTELSFKYTNGAIGRTALHSWKLRFAHPRTFHEINIIAPPPLDFQNACDVVGVRLPVQK